MLKTYAKIEKRDEDGDLRVSYVEPLEIEAIMVALETELIDEGEVGQSVIISLVEMTEDDYMEAASTNGY